MIINIFYYHKIEILILNTNNFITTNKMTEQFNCNTLMTGATALDDLSQYSSSDDEFEEYINREITDEIIQYTNDDEFESFINNIEKLRTKNEWEEEYGTIPQKAKFIVTGAGSTIVNGYYEENGIHNHKPKYRRIDTNGNVILYHGKPIELCCGGGWCMGIWLCADKGWVYDMVQSINPSLPPTIGWNVVNNGIAPLPTITFLDNDVEKSPTTSQKIYHGTINHASLCVDHTFWVYSPYLKLQNKWDTHLPVSTYCNNHVQHDNNTFICLGHTNQSDFISAQKEWKKNGWSKELVTSENVNTIKPPFRNVRYTPNTYLSSLLGTTNNTDDSPPSWFNADEKAEWEKQKREYPEKQRIIREQAERDKEQADQERNKAATLSIEEKVEIFRKQCPDGNSFEYRRRLELGEKVENFKKLYPEGKERNDYITKIRQDYLNLLSQEKAISNQYAIIEGTGVRKISGRMVVISTYSAGGRIYDSRNDSKLKKYEKKRDELLEPIRSKRDEQAKIMNDINSIYVNMGYCNSKVPFFRSY